MINKFFLKRKINWRFYFFTLFYSLFLFLLITIVFPSVFSNNDNGLFSFRPDFSLLFPSISFIFIIAFLAEKKSLLHDFTSGIILALEFIYFIPTSIYCFSYGAHVNYFWMLVLFYAIMNSLIGLVILLKKPKKISTFAFSKPLPMSNIVFYSLILLCILSSVVFYFLYGNNLLDALNFDNVYFIRAQHKAENIYWVFSSIYKSVAYLIPVMLYFSLKKRKYIVFCGLIICQILLYSIGCDKIFLYLIGLSAIISIFKISRKNFPILFASLALFAFIEYFFNADFFMNIIRRQIVTPGAIGNIYYEYFIQLDQPVYGITSVFPRISSFLGITSYYSVGAGYTIGSFWGQNNYNTGLVGAALGNYGMFGIVLSSSALVFFFCFLDLILSRKKDEIYTTILFSLFACDIVNNNNFVLSFFRPSNYLILLLYLIVISLDSAKITSRELYPSLELS